MKVNFWHSIMFFKMFTSKQKCIAVTNKNKLAVFGMKIEHFYVTSENTNVISY